MIDIMAVDRNNRMHNWDAVAKSFHWVLAVLILGQLILGQVAERARLSPLKLDLFVWHKSIGVTILLLVIFRFAWRLTHPPPVAPTGTPAWETKLARIGHTLLYILMFAVPLTGWWISDTSWIPFKAFWLIPVPDLMPANRELSELAAGVHGGLTKLLLLVVLIHIAAALRHHFLLHNEILNRMLPGRGRSKTDA
jgi:cytochrome b561